MIHNILAPLAFSISQIATPPIATTPSAASAPGTIVGTVEKTTAGIVAEGAPIRRLAEGQIFTEGPACDAAGVLYWTDIPRNEIMRLAPDGKPEVALEKTEGMNGLAFAQDGTLYGCASASGRIVKIDLATKSMSTVCDAREDGTPLGSVNDLCIARDGTIYFTAPIIGRKSDKTPPDAVLAVASTGGKAKVLVSDVRAPNGVRLSNDEKTLYVLPYIDRKMRAYPVVSAMTLGEGRVFYEIPAGTRAQTAGDGLCIDSEGTLYITVPARAKIFILSEDGVALGDIRFPENPSNCFLGGVSGHTLFVTAVRGVYAVELERSAPTREKPVAPASATTTTTPTPTQ
ncbi:MAG: hypothetical protein EXS10_00600 [Phycisphaerales bacterium]|nr:hypothetical protein [Phycisphaerales bacterium]